MMAWRLLLEKGAAVDAKRASGARGGDAKTAWHAPLMNPCARGHVEAARLLLEKGAAVEAKHENGSFGHGPLRRARR